MPNKVYLIRHGETPWSLSGRHTGATDIGLTARGEKQSREIGQHLKGIPFEQIWCSPLKRAQSTCELAQLLPQATLDPDLQEWNYGEYEGKTTPVIHQEAPDWNIFLHGAPGGESPTQMSQRADRVIQRLLSQKSGNIALFSHAHFLRALTARWLQLSVEAGQLFFLSAGSLSLLGYERETRVILLWNEHP